MIVSIKIWRCIDRNILADIEQALVVFHILPLVYTALEAVLFHLILSPKTDHHKMLTLCVYLLIFTPFDSLLINLVFCCGLHSALFYSDENLRL